MTIPIEPGPFSFLASAGEAVGNAFAAHEKDRQQKLKEAQDRLNQMITLRQAGLIKPEAFGSSEAMNLYKTLGILPVSPEATSGESIEQGKRNYLSQLSPQFAGQQPLSDEARSMIGAPERGLTEGINAKIAQNTAAVPTAQLQGAQATAALPGAGTTVIAGQQSDQDKQYNDIADRIVEGLYARNRKIPSGVEAYAVGQKDQRTQPFGTSITQPYYEQAAERLRQKLFALETQRRGAEARAQGASGTGLDDLLKIQQAQQTRITAELNALPKPSDGDMRMADLAQQLQSKGKPVPPIIAAPAQRVAEYNRRRAELEQQMQQVRDQGSALTTQALPTTPGATPPGTTGSPQKRAAATEFEQKARGVTDPAQRRRIAEEIAKKYGLPLPQRPQGAGGSF